MSGWNPQIPLTRVWQVYRSIHSYTRDVAITMIGEGKTTVCGFAGEAVIKNGKMVERLTEDETLLYNIFNKESSHGKIEVLNNATVMILNNSMNYNSRMENDIPLFETVIDLQFVLLETRGDPSKKIIKENLEVLLTER
ncbi:hypothetical protein BACCIP111883_01854 [Sutcliffiella rhizosphaerae]|uniref:Spore germination GerAC-like C-terminal domain-containing protein n=1 Tax=Sutcliffiella rhizosphaerae TaxID=2880967 RepID=A0ABM8YM98_9BACI|nr:hypothetical protein BACCIP111883_01854 [Sutcliffiella rhizosphaerae]